MEPKKQIREGVVWIDGRAELRYRNIDAGSVIVYRDHKDGRTELACDSDYIVDGLQGMLRAARNSAIRDYSGSHFYGVKEFDHTLFPTYGNYEYTYYTDYSFDPEGQMTDEQNAAALSLRYPGLSFRKDRLRYVVYGDSISTGAEASKAEYAYYNIFARYLKDCCGIRTEVINKAIGGETSQDGIGRFREDVLSLNPDLVSIGYGMNDQNRTLDGGPGHFVDPLKYKENVRTMAQEALSAGAQVLLLSPCLPNPAWKYSSRDMELYLDCLKEISAELDIALADVTTLWSKVLESGKTPQSLLLNDINHPNDYGHAIYAATMTALVRG